MPRSAGIVLWLAEEVLEGRGVHALGMGAALGLLELLRIAEEDDALVRPGPWRGRWREKPGRPRPRRGRRRLRWLLAAQSHAVPETTCAVRRRERRRAPSVVVTSSMPGPTGSVLVVLVDAAKLDTCSFGGRQRAPLRGASDDLVADGRDADLQALGRTRRSSGRRCRSCRLPGALNGENGAVEIEDGAVGEIERSPRLGACARASLSGGGEGLRGAAPTRPISAPGSSMPFSMTSLARRMRAEGRSARDGCGEWTKATRGFSSMRAIVFFTSIHRAAAVDVRDGPHLRRPASSVRRLRPRFELLRRERVAVDREPLACRGGVRLTNSSPVTTARSARSSSSSMMPRSRKNSHQRDLVLAAVELEHVGEEPARLLLGRSVLASRQGTPARSASIAAWTSASRSSSSSEAFAVLERRARNGDAGLLLLLPQRFEPVRSSRAETQSSWL